MKLACILLFGILLQLTTYAQQTGSKLYLINFRDKGLNKSMLSDPAQFLSAKAIDRRSRHHVAIDETDLPLNERYVNAVVSKGAHILARSRWFNYVLVESRATDPSVFASIPGVSRVRQLNDKKRVTAEWPAVKPYFSAENFAPYAGGFRKSSEANVYDYGAAANQINMIKGEFLHNLGYSGQGMTIAQLDAGFNSVDVMAAFDSLRVNNQILGTKNFVHPGENVYSTSINSHGTMVLSTMAANIQGVMVGTAPKASFWLLRTEDADSEYITEEYFWVNAAEFADSVGADIINSSPGLHPV